MTLQTCDQLRFPSLPPWALSHRSVRGSSLHCNRALPSARAALARATGTALRQQLYVDLLYRLIDDSKLPEEVAALATAWWEPGLQCVRSVDADVADTTAAMETTTEGIVKRYAQGKLYWKVRVMHVLPERTVSPTSLSMNVTSARSYFHVFVFRNHCKLCGTGLISRRRR